MPSPTQDISSGATIVYGTSNFTALLKNHSIPEISCNDVETTHQASVAGTDYTKKVRTFEPGDFLDMGEFTGEYYFNPDLIPPVGIKQTVTITWPSGATWVFQGYMKSVGGDPVEMDGAMMISAVTKCAGPIEQTSAS